MISDRNLPTTKKQLCTICEIVSEHRLELSKCKDITNYSGSTEDYSYYRCANCLNLAISDFKIENLKNIYSTDYMGRDKEGIIQSLILSLLSFLEIITRKKLFTEQKVLDYGGGVSGSQQHVN
jgi:hypothetical protein